MGHVSEARAEELRALVGDPAEVAGDLARFSEAAQALSSDRPRFIEKYPQKWVAVRSTDEVLAAETLDDLLKDLDDRGIPRSQAVVRFIARSERTLFL